MEMLSSQALKMAVINSGLSIKEMAAKADISELSLGRYLKSNSRVFLPTIKKLADALGVQASSLILKEECE